MRRETKAGLLVGLAIALAALVFRLLQPPPPVAPPLAADPLLAREAPRPAFAFKPPPASAGPAAVAARTPAPAAAGRPEPPLAPPAPPPAEAPAPLAQPPVGPRGTLEIRCRDDRGAPFPDLPLRLSVDGAPDIDARADERGEARVEVAPGSWRVQARPRTDFGGFPMGDPLKDVLVEAGARVPVELTVPRPGVLRGLVPGGAAGEGTLEVHRVHQHGSSTSARSITLDAEGRFSATLAPGPVEVTLLASGGASAPQKLEIEPGATIDAVFPLGGAIVIAGRVRAAESGAPIEGAEVSAGGRIGGVKAATGARGEFTLRGLAAVPPRVRASAPWRVDSEVELDPALPPPADLTIDLDPAGAVRLTILDAAGAPAKSLAVSLDTKSGSWSSETDEHGAMGWSPLPPGAYEVKLGDAPTAVTSVAVVAGETTEATLRLPSR